jgi:N-acetylglutamate synthase-like GNAT family acetyltransferase
MRVNRRLESRRHSGEQMRGQRLFIRPIDPADHDTVRDFLRAHGPDTGTPACGLLGKLVGNLVAVLGMQITADSVLIDQIVVAPDLRRKRVARLMLDEVEHLARKIDRDRLVVDDHPGKAEFLQRVGFEREGVRWIRRVRG